MYLSRWMPDILLGLFGAARPVWVPDSSRLGCRSGSGALIWRASYTEGGLPLRDPGARPPAARRLAADAGRRRCRAGAAGRPRAAAPVLVIRLPTPPLPAPGLLDRYISRIYLRIVGLSFLALLGLFYISTFLDKSDKIFKGQATTAEVGRLLVYMTPQFVYYVIPIAALLSVLVTFGLLSRNSELTVMKACGISLYRASLSVVLLSLVFSAAIFGLEQQVLAQANRRAEVIDAKIRGRTPRVFDALNRQWVLGRDGGDLSLLATSTPKRRRWQGLRIYQPATAWLAAGDRRPSAERATSNGGWLGRQVRIGDFIHGRRRWTDLRRAAAACWSRPTTSRPSSRSPK